MYKRQGSEPDSDAVESSRDDQGAQHALAGNTSAAILVSEVETAASSHVTDSGGLEPPNEEDDDVAAGTDQKNDSRSGTLLSTHADNDAMIEPSSAIMESSTTTRPIDLQQTTPPSAEESPDSEADTRSSDKDDNGHNGDGKSDALEVKHQEVDSEAYTAGDDRVFVGGEEGGATKGGNIIAGVVSDDDLALPLTHDTGPDTAGLVAEDAYKPDLEGIDTAVDVGCLLYTSPSPRD